MDTEICATASSGMAITPRQSARAQAVRSRTGLDSCVMLEWKHGRLPWVGALPHTGALGAAGLCSSTNGNVRYNVDNCEMQLRQTYAIRLATLIASAAILLGACSSVPA